ncbi:MAG TPA: hypothetical protein VF532_06700 [Candidatus Angelobacter sp.]
MLTVQRTLSAVLPIVAMGLAALAMVRSHRRPYSAIVIGFGALLGMGLGIGAGLLLLSTPEAAGRLGGVTLLLGISATSIWELARGREEE